VSGPEGGGKRDGALRNHHPGRPVGMGAISVENVGFGSGGGTQPRGALSLAPDGACPSPKTAWGRDGLRGLHGLAP